MEKKTMLKAGTQSIRHAATTNAQKKKRARSQRSKEYIQFQKNQTKYKFPIYQDRLLGFQQHKEELISMQVDEDQETTQSVMRFGQEKCIRDLENQFRSQNPQKSQYTFED